MSFLYGVNDAVIFFCRHDFDNILTIERVTRVDNDDLVITKFYDEEYSVHAGKNCLKVNGNIRNRSIERERFSIGILTYDKSVLAEMLGLVQSCIGFGVEILELSLTSCEDHDTDTARHENGLAVSKALVLETVDEFLSFVIGDPCLIEILHEDDELVTADTTYEVRIPED